MAGVGALCARGVTPWWCCQTDRLGALGFLYTGDDISGNYGILDQKYVVRGTSSTSCECHAPRIT